MVNKLAKKTLMGPKHKNVRKHNIIIRLFNIYLALYLWALQDYPMVAWDNSNLSPTSIGW